jgi:nucleoside-diphosphate-sugar epimerase
MRIFLTGASGFIGNTLSAQLLARGHDVSALVRRIGSAPPGTRAVSGELSDGALLTAALAAHAPDCVIHLATEIAGRPAVAAVMRSARSSNARIRRELSWVPAFPSAHVGVPAAVGGLVAA